MHTSWCISLIHQGNIRIFFSDALKRHVVDIVLSCKSCLLSVCIFFFYQTFRRRASSSRDLGMYRLWWSLPQHHSAQRAHEDSWRASAILVWLMWCHLHTAALTGQTPTAAPTTAGLSLWDLWCAASYPQRLHCPQASPQKYRYDSGWSREPGGEGDFG